MIRILTAAFAALALIGSAFAAEQTPEQFLRAIYAAYTSTSPSDGSGEEDNVRMRRIYEPELAELIIADYRKMQDMPGEPVLEFDPLLNAQDIDITGLVGIQVVNQTGDRAAAVVTFVNSGRKQTLSYSLVKVSGQWKIHDINWNGERTLRSLFGK
jgi:Protein of unknown function (DUF3828)